MRFWFSHLMSILRTLIFFLFAASGCALFAQDAAESDGGDSKPLPERKVVIIRDGESWYFDSLAEQTRAELEKLAEGIYNISFADYEGGNDSEKIAELISQALANPDTDLILAAGSVVTQQTIVLDDAERVRPILGGAVQFSDILDSAISEEGTSKIPNYSFITNPRRLTADFRMLRQLTGETNVHAVITRRILDHLPESESTRESIESAAGVRIQLVPVSGSASSMLAAIPANAKVVYVSILPELPPAERKKLFAGLAERGVRSMSMVGVSDVKLGAMAGLAPDNEAIVGRRAALNAHQMLLGIETSKLPVYLPVEDRLVINMASAERAGWSPDYETALTADFVEERTARAQGEEILHLEMAMRIAAQASADVLIQREQEEIARNRLQQSKTFRRPQVDINLQQSITDYSSRIDPMFTPGRANQGSYGLELRQILFNDAVRSDIAAARENVAAERLNYRSIQLDAMEMAGTAFLNYLAAQSLWRIQKENLRLTENNLQLARLRVGIGAAEEAETYRWEQDAASSRATLFQFEADRENARVELNRILARPRQQRWQFTDITVADDETYFLNNVLMRVLHNQEDMRQFGEFLRKVAVPASPELASFDYGLAAQGIRVEQAERTYFLPEVSAFGGLSQVGQSTDTTNYDTQGEATAGVQLTFPLYEGGLKKARLEGEKALVRQLLAQRERALQQIEQRALAALHGIGSQHPNIRLSRRALEAAVKNFDSVRSKYSQGAASILDLLDAQSALLGQRQQAALAVYSYLQEIVRMQRAVAWFEFDKSDAEKNEWEKMLTGYMGSGELMVPDVVKPSAADDATRPRAVQVVSELGEPAGETETEAESEPPRRRTTLRDWLRGGTKAKESTAVPPTEASPEPTPVPAPESGAGRADEPNEKKGFFSRLFQKKR